MLRLAALLWLALVVLAGGYMASRLHDGLTFRTDLLALLPREEQDPVLQRANDAVAGALSRRVVALVGAPSRDAARTAAAGIEADLSATGLLLPAGGRLDPESLKRLGALYYPHRRGLLAEDDRTLLEAGRGEDVAMKALAQVFGVGGVADASLLRGDPFLLLPGFFAGLPFPLSRLSLDEGMLTAVEEGVTWILVTGTLAGAPFALDVQERFVGAFDASVERLRAAQPDLRVKRLGAVFFAEAGSRTAIQEASTLATLSTLGAMGLILLVFRRATPLLHSLLALGVGLLVGFSGSLALFGELHVAALLFGSSLIGVAVDYSLHYSATMFDRSPATPAERLAHVFPSILLGLLTSLIGYAMLAVAPFPGLRQIAVFSILGLSAAFLTVVLWLPRLDRAKPLRHGATLLRTAAGLWGFWSDARRRPLHILLAVAAVTVLAMGAMRFRADDDVRRMQALNPALVAEQAAIQSMIGATTAPQFLLIEGADDEAALRRGEAVAPLLARLKREGVLSGYQMPAAFVPSAERQRANQALVRTALEQPFLARQRAALGMPGEEGGQAGGSGEVLTLERALAGEAVPLLRELVLAPGLHVATLQGLARPDRLRAELAGVPGVRLVDPTADFSALLAKYRERALLLTGLSAVGMFLALAWRLGRRRALRAMLPPLASVLLTVALLALIGHAFNFFHAMALVLVLSIGVDYAIFCAESGEEHRAVTMLAVWLATLTTLLSFGLLAASVVPAVHSFGATMLIGMAFAFFLAPLAAPDRQKSLPAVGTTGGELV
ncbi:hypothetical protein [Azospirillum sp. SYSU D00513]|uniref:MMPL family transporter n=1 Tax=Azospirillum sp. SYSU D00513 TaxID=2812561 RepID=UPI001A97CC6C|nr:hypothetical protein [Azospirillum sp. SYSU D00513]